MNILRHTVLSGATLLLGALTVSAQTGTVRGRVVNGEGSAVDFAAVVVKPAGLYTMTDSRGTFDIGKVPVGKVSLEVTFYGMEPVDTTFTLKAGQTVDMRLTMRETTFFLVNVTVVAKRSEAGRSTASEISRQAMDHMQTSSLGDIMALLPGVQISNPDLNTAQTLSVRNSAGTSMGSLGTAVLVDGAPVSNNANMQFLSTAQTGSALNEATSGSAATGIDIRALSTDNVESVEVIRGIPSVEYGDMTSGAVLVRSRAGRSPLTVRFKTNPNIYQISAAKGFNLSKKAGDLNLSGDYAYNRNSLIKDNKTYQRANLKALWSVMLDPSGRSSANTSLTLTYARDREKLTADSFSRDQSWANTAGVAFNHNGHAFLNRGWLKNVNWLFSGSFNDKVSHIESTASNALNLYSTALVDGVTYTDTPGQHLYDADGSEVTNAADLGLKGVVLPYSYFYTYDIYGKEVNAFAKVNADFSKTWDAFTDRLLAGADFKTDGNLGKGAVYDDNFPPFRSISNTSSGYRRRPYSDIPFVNQVGLYAEDAFFGQWGERQLHLSAGARFDWVNGLTCLAPRINASFDFFPWMTLRGGWGVTAKAPTAMYLYPNYAYSDELNFNGMQETLPVEERLLVATTHVFDTANPDLEIARNRKAELGLDFKVAGRYNLSVTYYDERMDNGYTMGLGLPSFAWFQLPVYQIAESHPGSQPSLAVDRLYNLFFMMYRPYNFGKYHNKGLEYEIDLGRFDAIRTSFYLNGAWQYGSSTSRGYSFSTRLNGTERERHIGIYNPGRKTGHSEELITTFRAVHNIPQIGFVISLTTQVDWYSRDWDTFRNPDMFVKYISYHDGQVHDFDASERGNPEFSYLFETPSSTREVVEKTSPYLLFNLNLTKEIGDALTASFYVNNIFNFRPQDRYEASGAFRELGIPMFFGFEVKVNIK